MNSKRKRNMEDKTEGNPIPEQWKGQILPFEEQIKKEDEERKTVKNNKNKDEPTHNVNFSFDNYNCIENTEQTDTGKNNVPMGEFIENVRSKDLNRDGQVYKEMDKIKKSADAIDSTIEKLRTRLQPIINKRKYAPIKSEQNNEQKDPIPCSPLVWELKLYALYLKQIDDALNSILDQLEL